MRPLQAIKDRVIIESWPVTEMGQTVRFIIPTEAFITVNGKKRRVKTVANEKPCVGEILSVGPDVTGLKRGDVVVYQKSKAKYLGGEWENVVYIPCDYITGRLEE